MREKKIVLFVVGDEHIWSGCYSVIQEVLFEYHVKYVDNYVAAYKIIVENNIDVMVCGPSAEQYPQNMAEAYRFIESARKLKRYQYTPIILITDVEDPSHYCRHNLKCREVIDPMTVANRLEHSLEAAVWELEHRRSAGKVAIHRDKLEGHMLYFQNENVLYPVKCRHISHIQAVNREMEVCLYNGKKYFTRYITLQKLLDAADVWYFLQCSRSGIINANYVRNIDYTNRVITMRNLDQLSIGTTFIKSVHAHFPTIQEQWQRKQRKLEKSIGE